MTIVWLVTIQRFLREYHNHVSQNATKTINWMVYGDGIKFYIEQTNGSNCYCYMHKGNQLPVELASLVDINGSVLGVEGIEEDDGMEEKLNDISNKIKYNQVMDK